VSVVRFYSTHLKTLSASLARGPPAAAGGLGVASGTVFGQGCHMVLKKFVGCTCPTSIHKQIHSC
jgi:hypothetical protein